MRLARFLSSPWRQPTALPSEVPCTLRWRPWFRSSPTWLKIHPGILHPTFPEQSSVAETHPRSFGGCAVAVDAVLGRRPHLAHSVFDWCDVTKGIVVIYIT